MTTSEKCADAPSVAGYRLLRVIGRGSRSTVWVASPGDTAVKVLNRAEVDLIHEIEALERAQGPHVVVLHDVDLVGSTAALLFERLRGDSLADLMRDRAYIEAGEAVTILAPLAEVVARLHAVGVAHGNITPTTILFRSDGAPTLIGFSRAELWAAGSPEIVLETIDAVARDREALRAIAGSILGRVSGRRERAARVVMTRLDAVPSEKIAALLGAELFDVAAAIPVRSADDVANHGVERDLGANRIVPISQVVLDPGIPRHRRERARARVGVVRSIADLLEKGPTALVRTAILRSGVTGLWQKLQVRRRRMIVAAGSAGLAVALAAVMVPGPSTAATDSADAPATAEAAGAQSQTTSAVSDDRTILGDDPLAALEVLLDRRAECYRTQSVLCLDGFDQPGSSASEADHRSVTAIADDARGEAALPRPTADFGLESAVISERLGDSALIELTVDTHPASLLLVRSEAGWRIRDYLIPTSGMESE